MNRKQKKRDRKLRLRQEIRKKGNDSEGGYYKREKNEGKFKMERVKGP